jgi:hypothetical protein
MRQAAEPVVRLIGRATTIPAIQLSMFMPIE